MSESRGAITGARRAAQIRRIVEDVMVRRGRGETVTDESVFATHPELMPDLAKELSLLALLERAKQSISESSQADGSPIEPLAEDAFAGYRVVGEIRRGGQGVVYEAVQSSTGRRVAIKMMREGHFAGDRDAARFEREVRILGQLDHSGIVRITASGIRGGHFYYVMDFVEGVPLDQYAAAVERRTRDVMTVMEMVADAVNAAHLRGIIHRDLKPGNILVDSQGHPRILDFGLARIASETDGQKTATGQFVGSLPWASPEQAGGDPLRVDLRTDVYSLGVIQYHALTGRFPYDVDSGPREAFENIANAIPARPRSISASIDAGAESITLKCLSKDPERRYQSAGELAADLRRYLSGRPVLAHPPSFWYQARSVARRHRALVVGIAAVLAALVLGLIGTSVGLVKASAARRAAVQDRDQAERHAYAASVAAADSALRVDDSGTAKAQLRSAPERWRGWEWRYLAARADQSRQTLPLQPVRDARTTPDGASLLVLDVEGVVSRRDLSGRTVSWSTPVPSDVPRGGGEQLIIGFSRDGARAVTQHVGTALVWNITDGTLIQRLDLVGTWGFVSAAFSPDGKRLLTSGRIGRLSVWDLTSGKLLKERSLNTPYSAGADFSPDGRHIAASTNDGVAILDAQTLQTIRDVKPDHQPRPDWGWVRYTPDGKSVIANCGDFIATLDPQGQRSPVEFRGGIQQFLPFELSPDGKHLAAGSWDTTVRVWNFATGAIEATLVGHEERVISASFAGDEIVSTSADGGVKVWSVAEPPGLVSQGSANLLDILPPGNVALLWGATQMRFVNLDNQRALATPLPPVGSLWAVSAGPDGTRLATTDGASQLRVWSAADGSNLWTSECPSGAVLATAFAADGGTVFTLHPSRVEARDAATGSLRHTEVVVDGSNPRLAVHPNRSELLVGAYWNSFIVIDVNTWTKRVVDYPSPTGLVVSFVYSADGSLVASGDTGAGVQIWDAATWKPLRRLTGLPPTVWSLAFSPDGARLAVGSQDRLIHIFETRDWHETLILRGHTGSVTALEWTPDGQKLVSASNDGTMRIWDAAPAKWAGGR